MTAAARALSALACVLLLAAALSGYAARALFDSRQFTDRAAAALQHESVRDHLADRITDELILANQPDLLTARPIIAATVAGVVGTDAFASVFRRGARDLHRALFARDEDTLTLTLLDVGTVAAAALRELRPELAAELERGDRVVVAQSGLGAVTGDLVRTAESLRFLALVLAGLALAAAAGAVALARDRRLAASYLGLGVVAAGLVIVVGGVLVRLVVLGSVEDPVRRAAAGAVWDAFLGDLRTLGWLLIACGAVVAAAAASVVDPRAVDDRLRAAWRAATAEPRSPALRVLRGAALAGAGLFTIVRPLSAVQIVATLAGAFALYRGLLAILQVTHRRGDAKVARPRARPLVAGVAALLIAGATGVFLLSGGAEAPAAPALAACNGHAELCERRLDQVVLPATHNAMSVPLPGWFAALHDSPIDGQLEDGIRGLLLDTHYADRLPNGRTRTDYADPDAFRRAIQQDAVSEQSIAAARRLRERVGFRGEGERGMFLCHTFCELGATPLEAVLEDIQEFLVTHPHDVLMIVNQDHVTPADFVAAVEDAGLGRYAFAPPAAGPWPMLRELVERDERLVILAENEAGGAPWYQLAYDRILQETPFMFGEPAELTDEAGLGPTCRPNRGPGSAPLFLVNHWINTDPAPRPTNAAQVNAFEPLLRRAQTCRRLRRHTPNLLAVDFYSRGDLFRVVDVLNGV